MKSISGAGLILSALGILLSGCSRIEIEKPAGGENVITTPYTLVVQHTGCGTINAETFAAWLDKGSDMAQEITGAFSYSQDRWTASAYDLAPGSHTLSVRADASTGGWCYEGKSSDQRTFFVAPCTDFVIGWGEDLQLVSDTLTIEYDTTVIEIAQGETKTISLAEDSPFLVNGQLPATVKYGLKNKTTKNLKFILLLNHGGTVLYQKDVAFCGESTLQEQQRVTFSPSAEPLMLTVEAGDMFASPSDDTRAVFFNGNLQLYVYPL